MKIKFWRLLLAAILVLGILPGQAVLAAEQTGPMELPEEIIEPETVTETAPVLEVRAAAFAGGSGTKSNPYQIENKYQLDAIRNKLSAHYKLIADIEFTDADFAEGGDFYNNGTGWQPIGEYYDNPFTGTLNGNGYAIKGLKINITVNDGWLNAGLFGYIKNSEVKNLGMVDSQIQAKNETDGWYIYAGSIAAYAYDSTITNCYHTGSVTVVMDTVLWDPAGQYAYAGGLVGAGSGTISNCYNTGSVTAKTTVVHTESGVVCLAGGIVGTYEKTISQCYNTGRITTMSEGMYAGMSVAGGIAGEADGITLSDCYNAGSIAAPEVGGIIGTYCYRGGLYPDRVITVKNCYNAGCLSGGIVNGITSCIDRAEGTVKLSNSYYWDVIDPGSDEADNPTKACTAEQLKQKSTYSGFDFSSVWQMGGNGYQLPTLRQVPHAAGGALPFAGGDGTAANPYKIATKEQLNAIRYDLTAHYKLIDDIIFTDADFASGGPFCNGGIDWMPIGTASTPFSGSLDGNGHTIQNLKVTKSLDSSHAFDSVGMFGCIKDGKVKNLGMVGGTVQLENRYNTICAGGIAGCLESGVIENCYNTGSVTSSDYAGGIVGYLEYGDSAIKNCYNTGTICGSMAGGILGLDYSYGGTVKECYNTGEISGTSCAGGVVGKSNSGIIIKNSHNTGAVTGDEAGGIVGYSYGCSITACYNTGTVTGATEADEGNAGGIIGYSYLRGGGKITDCYNTGKIIATGYAGGMVGQGLQIAVKRSYNAGSVKGAAGCTGGIAGYAGLESDDGQQPVSDCYYLNTVSCGVGEGADTATACTAAEMQQADTFRGFDFEGVWTVSKEGDYLYPVLLPPAEVSFLLGDVDGNEKVNIFDVTKLIYYINGRTVLSDTQLLAANVDEKGSVNVFDVMKLIYIINKN